MCAAVVPFNFVVRFGQGKAGSTRMRCHDLISIVGPYLPSRLRPQIVTMPGPRYPVLQRLWAASRPRDQIYFFTKSAFAIDPEAASILRRRSRGLAFDYIDGDLTSDRSRFADVHVCASFASETRIKDLQSRHEFSGGPTKVILHNGAFALYNSSIPRRDRFSIAYCGTAQVTRIPDDLRTRVTMLDAQDNDKFNASIPALLKHPMHYCIRARSEVSDLLVKPFTKGVTAALCGANVLVSRSVPDAVHLLGPDYPFFTQDETDQSIALALQYAEEAFAGPEWQIGLERMAELREQVSGPSLAARLTELAAMLGVE